MAKRSWLLLGSVVLVLVLAVAAGYELAPRAVDAAPHQEPAKQEVAAAMSQSITAEAQARKGGAWLGVQIANADNVVSVVEVVSDSPAAKAGVQKGDIITAVNGDAITNTKQLVQAISGLKSGDKVALSMTRNGASQTIDVVLGSVPAKVPSRIPMVPNPLGGLEGLLPDLPGLGADQRFDRFQGATFSFTDESGAPISIGVTPGQVTAVTTTTITLRPNAGGAESTYQVSGTTKLFGLKRGQLTDSVKVGDKVMVIAKQGASDALAVYDQSAFGRRLMPPGHPPINPSEKAKPNGGQANPNSQFRDRFRQGMGALGRNLDQLRQRLELPQPAS